MSTTNGDINATTPFLSSTAERPRNSHGVNWSNKMLTNKGLIRLTWNTVKILVTIVVMILSKDEITKVPVRVWLVGYIVLCMVHMVNTYFDSDRCPTETVGPNNSCNNNITALFLVELATKICCFVWWIIGLYWVISGEDVLRNDAPKLYWLATIFLSFESFSIMVSITAACTVCVRGQRQQRGAHLV